MSLDAGRVPRYEGEDKVRGGKIYARDFFPGDFTWTGKPCHALVLRSLRAGCPFEGLLPEPSELAPHRPYRTILAKDLMSNLAPFSLGGRLLVPTGKTVAYQGEPVALLLFDQPADLRAWCDWLRGGGEIIRHGARARGPRKEQDVRRGVNPLLHEVDLDFEPKPYAETHYVLHPGTESPCEPPFSYRLWRAHNPQLVGPEDKAEMIKKAEKIQDQKEKEKALREVEEDFPANIAARDARFRIERDIGDNDWNILERTFSTQITDPMFMEPEAGLAWHDKGAKKLHLVYGTQSAGKDRANIVEMMKDVPGWAGTSIEYKCTYPGGGFGGRDESVVPLYLAAAALHADDRPVRLAFDRFEQFLTGIKRHATGVQSRLAYDNAGNLQALLVNAWFDGGGQANLTPAVVSLGALHARGCYRIPRAAISSYGVRTQSAPAGSKRGFGIPQVNFAIESMIDEVAVLLGRDPVEFRLERVVRQGDEDVAGMPLHHHLANDLVCEEALRHPLWKDRTAEKQKRDRDTVSYGVGFACCMEAYGTSSDATYAEVSLAADGTLTVRSPAVDMGQGTATALSLGTRELLGSTAHTVELGMSANFIVMGLTSDPKRKTDWVYTPKLENSMSASITAFLHVHAVEEAARVLFEHTILPIAAAIWGDSAPAETVWENGALTAPGRDPLPLARIAEVAEKQKAVAGVMVHTFFQGHFSQAKYKDGMPEQTRNIDGLALRRAGEIDWKPVERYDYQPPKDLHSRYRRSLYATVGHLVAVEVYRRTGQVRVLSAVTILDAGKVHHPDLLAGQVEGGLAMGIGTALYEELPPAPAGSDGTWNLHRYRIPRASEVPLRRTTGTNGNPGGPGQELIILPFKDDSVLADFPEGRPAVPRKGIAEATMTTIPAAIHNAIAHATGLRLNRLPMTPERVLRALEENR